MNTIQYDGESRQIYTSDSGTGQSIGYSYDGLGQRMQRQLSGGATTFYIHDAFGNLAAEYNSAGVTPACTTCYLSYDQLGSLRMVTDQNATIVARHDYLPFGEEILNGQAGRSTSFGFGNSATITQMFTGQERDGGTATLDYFNARHFSAVLGSLTQPDPMNTGGDIMNPQSWNAYAYVLGNPLGLVDPSGMCAATDATPCYSGGTTQSASNDFGGIGTWAWWMNFGWRTLVPNPPTSGGGSSGDPVFGVTGVGKEDVSTVSTPPGGNDPAKNLNCVAFNAVTAAYPQTNSQTLEYGGFIVTKPDRTYYYTPAFAGSQISMGSNFYTQYNSLVLSLQKGSSIAGWYHDHPKGPLGYDPEHMSDGDRGATNYIGGPGFLLTPNRKFWRVDPRGRPLNLTRTKPCG